MVCGWGELAVRWKAWISVIQTVYCCLPILLNCLTWFPKRSPPVLHGTRSLHSCPSADAKSSASLVHWCQIQSQREFWVKQKRTPLSLCQAKKDTVGSCPRKLCVPIQEDLVKSFIALVQGWCCGSQMVGLLILMPVSCPFNLASSGLAAPLLISNCLNLPFGTRGRSWRLVMPTGNRGQ